MRMGNKYFFKLSMTSLGLFLVVSLLSEVAIFIDDAITTNHNKKSWRYHYFYSYSAVNKNIVFKIW